MKRKVRTAFRIILISFCVLFAIGTLAVLGVTAFLLEIAEHNTHDIVSLAGNNGMPSSFYTLDENGNLIEYAAGELSAGRSADYATLDEIPQDLENAFIAIEDKRFYSHIGFDPITTAKAAFKYLFASGSSPGGSTITQQLIKNLTGEDDISIKRKLTEIMTAVKLERELSKDSILELYLNSIYLSQGTYGVKAAAKLYFNKDVSELTLLESAAIAAITQAPTKWDPILHPENNLQRRNVILNQMLAQGYISQEEYSQAYDHELTLSVNRETVTVHTTSWFTDAAINESVKLLSEALGISEKAATQHLYNGGYKITVTVDTRVQSILEKYYYDEALFGNTEVQSSFVILDPENGAVLGLVGGLGEKTASRVLNRATQTVRSPGSAIKPLSVYLPALDAGIIHYGSSFDDAPSLFGGEYDADGWPKNADRIYQGRVDLAYALSHSSNTVAVEVLRRLGIKNSFAYVESLGIDTLVKEGSNSDLTLSSLALGGMTNGVSLMDLCGAYTVLANQGVFSSAHCISTITDASGKVIVDNQINKRIAADEASTQSLTQLLRGVISDTAGTAYGAITKLPQMTEVAGKTGTTSNNHDRWFVGYTPELIGGIWIGYDEPQSLTSISGKKHLLIWDEIMTEVHTARSANSKTKFDRDLLIEARYCKASGAIATSACYADPRGNQIAVGYFTESTLPESKCTCHTFVSYCEAGNGVAGEFCPLEQIKPVGLMVVERAFLRQITIADAQYTAMELPDGYKPFFSLSDPYYLYYIPNGIYVGRSDTATPYNKACAAHLHPIVPPEEDVPEEELPDDTESGDETTEDQEETEETKNSEDDTEGENE